MGKTAARPADNFNAASAECAALGRRLPTIAELDAYRRQPGTQTAIIGWRGNLIDDATALGVSEPGGVFTLSRTDFNAQSRCVA